MGSLVRRLRIPPIAVRILGAPDIDVEVGALKIGCAFFPQHLGDVGNLIVKEGHELGLGSWRIVQLVFWCGWGSIALVNRECDFVSPENQLGLVDQILAHVIILVAVEGVEVLRDLLKLLPCLRQVDAIRSAIKGPIRRGCRDMLVDINERDEEGQVCDRGPKSDLQRPEGERILALHNAGMPGTWRL